MTDSFVFGTIIGRSIALASSFSTTPNGNGGNTTTVSWYDLPEELRLNSNSIRIYGDVFGNLILTDGVNSYTVPLSTGQIYYGIGSWRGTLVDFMAQPALQITPINASVILTVSVLGVRLDVADSQLTVTNHLQRIVYPSGLTVNLLQGVPVTGTDASETLYGFGRHPLGVDLNDIINAGGGDDLVYGRSGNDVLNGQDGNDRLFDGNGNDSFNGGAGFDTAVIDFSSRVQPIELVADLVAPGTAAPIIIGGITAGTIIDVESLELTGGSGDDRLGGRFGFNPSGNTASNIDGGAGRDVAVIDLSAATTSVTQNGSVGFGSFSSIAVNGSTISVGMQNIEALDFTGGSGNDYANGGNEADILRGGAGDDVLSGGRGNDIILPGSGRDSIDAGEGDDRVIASTVSTGMPLSLFDGGDGFDSFDFSVAASSLFFQTFLNRPNVIRVADVELSRFERIVGGSAADTIGLTGMTVGVEAWAGGGNDAIWGGSGADTLYGEDGDDAFNDVAIGDRVYGGTGNDSFFVSGAFAAPPQSGIVDGGAGLDRLDLNIGFYVDLAAGSMRSGSAEYAVSGIEEIRAAANAGQTVAIFGSSANESFSVNPLFNQTGSMMIFDGRGGDDILSGSISSDQLTGGDGNDRLSDGGVGNGNGDTLIGGIGNDVYIVAERSSSTLELAGEGIDEVRTAFSIYGLQANVENLTALDNATHAALVGNILDNVITGGTGTDDLFGRTGNDTLIGGIGAANTLLGQEGDDVYVVSAIGDSVVEFADEGTDTVRASVASFTLGANVENLTFTGGATARIGVGNDLSNQIRGLGGDDSLNGLGGDDIITAGSGADLLQGGSGADQFRYEGGEVGLDRILDFLSGTDKLALSSAFFTPTGTVSFVSGVGAVANTANSTILYDPSTGIVSYDDDGNGAGAAVQIAQLNGGQTFVAGDFLFY